MCWGGCARPDQVRPADAQPTLNHDAMINSRVEHAGGRIWRLDIMMLSVVTVRVGLTGKCAFCAS
jgi:hypothetical protein